VRPRLLDDHQPEMAFRYVSVAETGCAAETGLAGETDCAREPGHATQTNRAGKANRATKEPARHSERSEESGCDAPTPSRPLRLLPQPVPIRVIALVPDGPPTWLAYGHREHLVAHASGPERLETAWWRGPDIRRDYFRVIVESGAQFWVFRSNAERQWYLHGVFA